MKKYVLLLVGIMMYVQSFGQVTISLNVDSHPNPRISSWVDRDEIAQLTVTNSDQNLVGTEYKIKVKMFLDDNLVLQTNNQVAVQTLELGTQTFLADEIIPYSAVKFESNSFRNHVIQTGMLPAGEYQFCVKILDLNGNAISTPEVVCQPMVITDYQLPELLTPDDNEQISNVIAPSIIFRWTPLTPVPPGETVKYILKVVEVNTGQSSSQAFQVNYGVIEEEVNGNQFLWPTDLDVPDEETQYVWSVKPVNEDDMPYKEGNNGFVGLKTFTIVPDQNPNANDAYNCVCQDFDENDFNITITRLYPSTDPNAVSIIGLKPLVMSYLICNNQDPSQYDVRIEVNWDEAHQNLYEDWGEQAITHIYHPEAPLNREKIPEQICITIKKVNRVTHSTCIKQICLDVPTSIRNAVNGTAECDCDLNITQPQLTLSQPEPVLYPRKLELHNVTQLRDFVRDCNSAYKEIDPQYNDYKYTFTTTINWDSNHSEESITNNGPFQHLYTTEDEIPEQICINIKIEPKPGYSGTTCNREFCVNVPQNIRDLNVSTTSTGNIVVNDTIHAGHNGEFDIIATQVSQSNGKFTGEGNAYIDWLKARVKVKFDSITIDSTKTLIAGKILVKKHDQAPQYPEDWAAEVVSNNPMANNIAENIVTWVENHTGQNLDYNGLNQYTTPVKLPLGVNMPNGDKIAITEMVFRPDKSEFNMVAAKLTPPNWGTPQQLVGFEAKNVHFHPNQIQTPPERIELIEDVWVGNPNANINYTFKAPTNSNPGCYIEWDENGFSQFGIELEANFTRDWLIPEPDDGTSKSKATFVGTGSSWNDLVLSGSLNKSKIMDNGEETGLTVEANNITMDMSDTQNPPNMVFPDNYPPNAETSNLFRGFYMKNLEVEIDQWETHSGGPPKIAINDLIINNSGITFTGEATNVRQFPDASVADMAASIDTVFVSVSASHLVDAGINGRIALPVSKVDSIQNPLQYNADFHVAQNPAEHTNFQLTIEPTGPINAHLLKGQMQLDQTSNIQAYIDKNKKTFQSTLNGNFVWDDVTLGPVKHINFDLGFEGIELNYNSSLQNDKLQFNSGHWAFASPQKFLANFPVTLENIKYVELGTTQQQYLHGKLNFDVIFNLSKKIGGKSKLAVEMAVEENNNGNGKFKPKYIGTGIDDINVYAHLAAVSIDGTIQFRNDDPVYGNGFKGNVSATFKAPKIAITAEAEFGNTNYQYSSIYRYWRVQAAATFQPGLPFLPGVAFYGFGGGAYNNMQGTLQAATSSQPAHYDFSPHKGNLGFLAKATIGTTPKVETFNADVGLNGQFSSSQGLINIGFTGDFYVGAPLMPQSKRLDAQIKGNLLADYNFPDKHFYFNVTTDINKSPVIVANNQSLVLDINGKTNKWFFKFGEPQNLNNVKVFGLNLYQYLMFGNDIQAPANGFTEGFRQAYHNATEHYPGIPGSTGVGSNTATGRGLALGVGFKFNKNVNKQISGNYYFYANMQAGAEINLSMLEYTGQNCANPSQRIGFNGWRARGSLGFYTNAGIGVEKGSQTWQLADFLIAGWLDGRFPRPTYVSGAIEGQIRIGHYTTKVHLLGDCKNCSHGFWHKREKYDDGHRCGGKTSCSHYQDHYLLNLNFNSSFNWGPSCAANDNNTSPDTGPSVAQQDAAADQEQLLIKYVHPINTYNVPTDMPFAVKFGLPVNEAFDVTEQQSDGSVITRTFKLITSATLKEVNQQVYVQKSENNLGEYLYIKGTINTNTTNVNLQNVPMSRNGSGNTNTGSTTPTAPVQVMHTGLIRGGGASYPPPTPPSEYNNLPPATPPVVNNLIDNKSYTFTVTATLLEYKNNQWVNAKKSDGTDVKQTIVKYYHTGPFTAVTTNSQTN